MNLNDPRDLLWMAGVCYGISFVVGMLKTFRVEIESLKNIPILAISDSEEEENGIAEP